MFIIENLRKFKNIFDTLFIFAQKIKGGQSFRNRTKMKILLLHIRYIVFFLRINSEAQLDVMKMLFAGIDTNEVNETDKQMHKALEMTGISEINLQNQKLLDEEESTDEETSSFERPPTLHQKSNLQILATEVSKKFEKNRACRKL